ncbi:hypothetical protein PENTCL1PPCAC_11321 [Pristionchus entomophagus]|uniref:Transmembrane protein n=1 Tax=Pristionchus entomophagus TaxID=358040 RepID=A0AAV5T0Y5_9BILA|nr:hypothetical protein PENTCL1PPCAC_11321 [Pristionchus entomophagus]
MSFSSFIIFFTLPWSILAQSSTTSTYADTNSTVTSEEKEGGITALHIGLIVGGCIALVLFGICAWLGYVKYQNYKLNKNWNGNSVWNRQREKELNKAKKAEEERKQKMDKGAIEEEEKKDNEMWEQVDKMKKPVDGFTTSQLLNPK